MAMCEACDKKVTSEATAKMASAEGGGRGWMAVFKEATKSWQNGECEVNVSIEQ